MLTKEAWLIMIEGPLKRKAVHKLIKTLLQLVVLQSVIFIFKDSKIDPFHATINIIRDYYGIEDRGSNEGVLINVEKKSRENDC